MNHIVFSVVIPALNEEKYLPRLLKNLSEQTLKSIEVIIVDGKSHDNTVAVAKEYAHYFKSFEIIVSGEQNVGYQRNLGAKKAGGEYLVFFDADVLISKSFLEKVYYQIQKKKYFLVTTYLTTTSKQPKDKLMISFGNIAMEAALRMEKPFAGGFNIIIHRTIFEQIGGFDPHVVHAEDHDLVQRCHKAGVRLALLPHPRLAYSFRRFKKLGYMMILQEYSRASLYVLLKGPIKKAIYDYPMGGQLYEGKVEKPEGGFKKFERVVIQSIRKMRGVMNI